MAPPRSQEQYPGAPRSGSRDGGGGGGNNAAAARQESLAVLRKRQVAQLDLSDFMTDPAALRATQDVLAGPPSAPAAASSFERPWAPRSLLYPALVGASGPGRAAVSAFAASGGNVEAKVGALHAALAACLAGAPRSHSSRQGKFVCRPEQLEMIDNSTV